MNSTPHPTFPRSDANAAAKPLPRMLLAAAGLAVLNGVLGGGIFATWLFQREAAVAAVRLVGAPCLLLAMAGIAVGSWVQYKRKAFDDDQQAGMWSAGATLTGLASAAVLLLIPISAAIEAMSAAGG